MITKHLLNKVVATLKNEASSTVEMLTIIILATVYDTLWEVRKFMQNAQNHDREGKLLELSHSSIHSIKDMICNYLNDVVIDFRCEELDENPLGLKQRRLEKSQEKVSKYITAMDTVVSKLDNIRIDLFNDMTVIESCLDVISDALIDVRNQNLR